jgi:hypothetical protein
VNITSSKEFMKTGLRYLQSEFLRCAYIVRLSTHRYPMTLNRYAMCASRDASCHSDTERFIFDKARKQDIVYFVSGQQMNFGTRRRSAEFFLDNFEAVRPFLFPVVKTGTEEHDTARGAIQGELFFQEYCLGMLIK